VLHSFVDGGNVILVDWSKRETGALSRLKDFTAWVDSEVGGGGGGESHQQTRLFLYVLPTKRKNQVRILGKLHSQLVNFNSTNQSQGSVQRRLNRQFPCLNSRFSDDGVN